MNFKDSYKNEMKHIKHNAAMDNKILESMEQPVRKRINFAKWGVAVAAMLCVAVISMNADVIASYTEAMVGKFGLYVGGKKIKLSEMTPIEVDFEKYAAYNKEKAPERGDSFFDNQELLEEHTGIVLTESEHLELKDISTMISAYYRTGHLSMDVLYNGKAYGMNGMFILEGYDHKNLKYGYGEKVKPYYTYEYAEDKYAYFVRDDDYETKQKVYFAERGIMYQLFVEKSEEGTEIAKKIVEYMAE